MPYTRTDCLVRNGTLILMNERALLRYYAIMPFREIISFLISLPPPFLVSSTYSISFLLFFFFCFFFFSLYNVSISWNEKHVVKSDKGIAVLQSPVEFVISTIAFHVNNIFFCVICNVSEPISCSINDRVRIFSLVLFN